MVTAIGVTVIQTGWSDFVFDSSYVLPGLPTLGAFVRTHGHLPDVPSAEELAGKGLDVGNMQKLQMQKIEELTLYAIEADRRLREEDSLLVRQDRRISEQDSLMERQEKVLREMEAVLQVQQGKTKH